MQRTERPRLFSLRTHGQLLSWGLRDKPGAFGIAVAMAVTVPGMDKPAAEALVKAAHEVCPYSNATRGNVDVALTVV